MTEQIRVAILGQGRSGRDIHGKHLLTDERYRVVAVVEPLEDRRLRAASEYGCETFSDVAQIVDREDIQLVVNSTPSNLHVPVTGQLLRAGRNVICEKPLARHAAEVDSLVSIAESSGAMLAVFQQSRLAPYFAKVQEVIGSGLLGRIVHIGIAFSGFARRWDWQCLQSNNGGNLLNTGPHPLDQALCLLDSWDVMPEVVSFMDRANTSGDAEDYVTLSLRVPGRPAISLEISSCAAYPGPTYNVQGTSGGLRATTTRADWRWFDPAALPRPELVRGPLADERGLPAYCSEKLEWHEGAWEMPAGEDMFAMMSRSYYDMIHAHLTRQAPLTVTLRQVRQQIAVIEECHRQNPLR